MSVVIVIDSYRVKFSVSFSFILFFFVLLQFDALVATNTI